MATPAAPEEKTEKKRILIVDDHAVLREGVAALINHEPDLAVCGQAASAAAALAALAAAVPDLLLVDIALEGSDGLELIRTVREAWPTLPQLVLSAHEAAHYAERALRAGARGYVMKARSGGVLVQAIRAVLAGEIYLGEAIRQAVPEPADPRENAAVGCRPEDCLSQRELLVFEKLGSGQGSQEVARELGLSPHTIQRYRENIKRKLKLASAAELQRAAFEYHYSKNQG